MHAKLEILAFTHFERDMDIGLLN